MKFTTPFYTGETVITRRGKRGTVVSCADGTVDVRFGGKVFTMRWGQVVSEHEVNRMNAASRYARNVSRYQSER